MKTHRGKRHYLDLSNLPLVELACLLRRLGRKMLDALLADEPPPDWLCLLSRVDTRVATRMEIKRIGIWRRLAWYPEDLLLNPGGFYREVLRETVRRGVRKNKWQREATDFFALTLSTYNGRLPDHLWSLLGSMAWGEPRFRHYVITAVDGFQRQQNQPCGPDIPMCCPSPNAFWSLLLLASLNPRPSWVHPENRRRALLARRLLRAAKRMLAADHWAGFWEQWLLRLARERWPEAFLEVDTELQLLWYSLPLVGPVKAVQDPRRRWQRAIEKP